MPHLAKLQAREQRNKIRITMWVDEDVVATFRARAAKEGSGYQTEMNRALREAASGTPLTAHRRKFERTGVKSSGESLANSIHELTAARSSWGRRDTRRAIKKYERISPMLHYC